MASLCRKVAKSRYKLGSAACLSARLGVTEGSLALPPLHDGIDGELGRIRRLPHVEIAAIAAQLMDAIEYRTAQALTEAIVSLDLLGLTVARRKIGGPATRAIDDEQLMLDE